MSPAKPLLGYELPKRGDWATPAYRKERQAQRRTRTERMREIRRNQEEYNRKKYPGGDPERIYVEGDLVMVRDERALKPEFTPRWMGPKRIVRRLSDEVYEVEREGDVVKIHVNKLHPAPRGNPELQEIEEDPSSDDSSTDSSLSEAELSDLEEERPEDPEERNYRDQEAAAIRSERDVSPAPREVTRKDMEEAAEPRPGPSREGGRKEEEEEERKGRRQATTWSWSVPTTSSTPDIPITISLPKNLILERYLPPPTVPRHRERDELLTKTKEKQSGTDPVLQPPQEPQEQQQQENQQQQKQREPQEETPKQVKPQTTKTRKPKEDRLEVTPRSTVKRTQRAEGKGSPEPPPTSRPQGRRRRRRLVIMDAPSSKSDQERQSNT